eukprot:scaffold15788_cov60-Phaeocystis_antarctica.AAC.3
MPNWSSSGAARTPRSAPSPPIPPPLHPLCPWPLHQSRVPSAPNETRLARRSALPLRSVCNPSTTPLRPLQVGAPEDFVELSNGCVCCSSGEDLLGALAELVSLSFMRGKAYDHLVVECSGIAEPRLVRRLFQDAQAAGWPLMQYLSLENMVSVVDAEGFSEVFNSG